MSSLSFLSDRSVCVIADASAIINLNGTTVAAEIIEAIGHPVRVTENAWEELGQGAQKGYDDCAQLDALAKRGLTSCVSVSALGFGIYESLITGSTLESLDDGEAATIAYACEVNGIALIDEAKAKRICAVKFPGLELISTTALLVHPELGVKLGADRQSSAILNALKKARMNVPRDLVPTVLDLIGVEAARECLSLPKLVRTG